MSDCDHDRLFGDVLVQPRPHSGSEPVFLMQIPPLAHARILKDDSDRLRVKRNVFIIDQPTLAILQNRVESSKEETDEQSESELLFGCQGRIGARTPKVHLSILRLDQRPSGIEDALCQLADAVGTYRLGILPHLKCEVGQSNDDRDTTDEVSEISERIENNTPPSAA